jgi:hypothetical protein
MAQRARLGVPSTRRGARSSDGRRAPAAGLVGMTGRARAAVPRGPDRSAPLGAVGPSGDLDWSALLAIPSRGLPLRALFTHWADSGASCASPAPVDVSWLEPRLPTTGTSMPSGGSSTWRRCGHHRADSLLGAELLYRLRGVAAALGRSQGPVRHARHSHGARPVRSPPATAPAGLPSGKGSGRADGESSRPGSASTTNRRAPTPFPAPSCASTAAAGPPSTGSPPTTRAGKSVRRSPPPIAAFFHVIGIADHATNPRQGLPEALGFTVGLASRRGRMPAGANNLWNTTDHPASAANGRTDQVAIGGARWSRSATSSSRAARASAAALPRQGAGGRQATAEPSPSALEASRKHQGHLRAAIN